MWSAQAVRELKIDHTNAIYLHSVELEECNGAVVGIKKHTHTFFLIRLTAERT